MLFSGLEEQINSSLTTAQKEASIENGQLEIEVRLRTLDRRPEGGIGSEDAFQRALRLFRSHIQGKDEWNTMVVEMDVVEYFQNGYRSIKKEGQNDVRYELKKAVNDSIIRSENWPIVVSFAFENKQPSNADEKIVAMENSAKRSRTRWSFIYAPGPDFKEILRVDFTRTHVEQAGKEHLEFEIEVEAGANVEFGSMKLEGQNYTYTAVQTSMSTVVLELLRYVHNTPILIPIPIRRQVILDINTAFDPQKPSDVQLLEHYVNKPRTMEWADFDRNTAFSLFPPEGVREAAFAVTIKTDGVRILVYYHSTGVYLFNPLGQIMIRLTDKSPDLLLGSMLDGELIAKPYTVTETMFTMWTFDCLFVKSPSKNRVLDRRNQNLMTRLKAMRYVCRIQNELNASSLSNVKLALNPKTFLEFYDRETFYNANKTAMKQNIVNGVEVFKSDGLVFTDMGPYMRAVKAKCRCRAGTKNCAMCRDFNPSINRKFKPVELLTTDFMMKNNDQDVLELHVSTGGGWTTPFVGTKEIRVAPTQFLTDFVEEGKKMSVQEGKIYEFQWSKVDAVWIPIRARPDRIVPNNESNAMANWRVIHNDIPKGVLTGNLKGKKVLTLMRKYHNYVKQVTLTHWNATIKAKLQLEGETRRPRLFDIGSAYGGDVKKWKLTDFEVYALEPDPVRLDELETRATHAGVRNRIQTIQIPIQEHGKLEAKIGTTIKKCDLVTCFHVMTLVYDSADSVRKFVKSLKAVLKIGGTFVCMAMDGAAIHKQLGPHKQLTMEGIKIQRASDDPRKIVVKMVTSDASLAKGQTEYLVDFDYLIATLESEGFELTFDGHLTTAALLNDTELWWSQMTRMIEMRYVGAKQMPTIEKKLDLLSSIMKSSMSSRQVEPDQIIEIKSRDLQVLSPRDGEMFWLVGVMAGGSSFFHALMWCIDQKYRQSKRNANFRFERVVRLRLELARALEKSDIPSDLYREEGLYSYDSCRETMTEYTAWCGNHFLPFIERQLGVNVFVLSWVNGELRPVRDMKDTFDPTRLNVILHCHDNGRYEPVGRSLSGESALASFVFASNDVAIRQLI